MTVYMGNLLAASALGSVAVAGFLPVTQLGFAGEKSLPANALLIDGLAEI